MDNQEFKDLVKKYLSSRASEEEIRRLFHYYEELQANTTWDEKILGKQQDLKDQIFKDISREIAVNEFRASFFSRYSLHLAACLIIIAGLAITLLLRSSDKEEVPVRFTRLTAGSGRITKLTLSDGTEVWLNSGSTLKYPEKFNGKKREVILDGEAFFDVTPLKVPFIIRSGKMITHVLGTSFNVRAFSKDRNMLVTVATGKVGVSAGRQQSGPSMLIEANEQIVYDKTNNALKKVANVNTIAVSEWRTGRLSFRNLPFGSVIRELDRVFNVSIKLSEGLEKCNVYGDFEYKDGPEKILKMLSISLNGHLHKQGNGKYYLEARRCN